jgi:antitoxin (DNA-binding transcriptional repressor) of toxin-antitoxin stability system
MNRVNIHDAKTHLSEYIANLKEGETMLLCRRNKPVAELRLLPRPLAHERPLGLAKAVFEVPESFFENLPEDIIHSFSDEHHETVT